MPHSPTSLQSETSRRNGALSRGPVTEAGKAASSQNAVRHGLRGGGFAVRAEESDWYAGLLATHLELYAPANAAEQSFVEALCMVELKLFRLDLLELRVLEPTGEEAEGEEKSPRLPTLATLARYRSRLVKDRWDLDHRLGQLVQRRKALGVGAEAARQELRQEARARALTGIALMGVLGSGLLAAKEEKSTKELKPADTDHAGCADGPEAPASTGQPTEKLNRRQRRFLERVARRKAAQGQMAQAA